MAVFAVVNKQLSSSMKASCMGVRSIIDPNHIILSSQTADISVGDPTPQQYKLAYTSQELTGMPVDIVTICCLESIFGNLKGATVCPSHFRAGGPLLPTYNSFQCQTRSFTRKPAKRTQGVVRGKLPQIIGVVLRQSLWN